ncbi:hypothetical protein SOVF_047020 [Spinacia oleracea]|nr:hypothetical protein SOVF_047020 [Spinacia oleracea]
MNVATAIAIITGLATMNDTLKLPLNGLRTANPGSSQK